MVLKRLKIQSLDDLLWIFLVLFCFFIPLKLSVAYAFLIPLIYTWLGLVLFKKRPFLLNKYSLISPLFLFILIALLSSIFGLNITRSLSKVISFSFYACLSIIVVDLARSRNIRSLLLALIGGQTIAGIHTIFEALLPLPIPKIFLGAVTEAGQLALTTTLVASLIISKFKEPIKKYFFIALPILSLALLINLKRGPWFGVFVALLIVLRLYAKKWVVPLILSVAAIALSITPIRNRLQSASEHFFIHGGRSVIWDIGAELSSQYPLGIGYANSPILRQFSYEIPQGLNHFHSNFLNILVETGWIGCAFFFWWISTLIIKGFRLRSYTETGPLFVSLAAGILASQLAGAVEYNVGDSEVFLIVLLFAGIMQKLYLDQRETLQMEN